MSPGAPGRIGGPDARLRGHGAFRVVAGLLALFWGYLFYGLIDLLVFVQGKEFHASFQLETGWGLFFLLLVAAPLLAIALVPRRGLPAAVQQVMLAGLAMVVGAVLSESAKHLLPAIGLLMSAAVVAPLIGGLSKLWQRPGRWSWGPVVALLVGAGPWLAYALSCAASARAGDHVDQTWGLAHFPVQSALGLGIVLVAALAVTKPRGWVVPAWSAGLCSAWLGVTSVVHPDLDASLGRVWGTAAAVWGVAIVVVAHLAPASGAAVVDRPPEQSAGARSVG
jgi:hypothetical protein